MAQPAEIYIQGDAEAVSLEGRRLVPVEPTITALRTKQRQRVTETVILRHVLTLHLLVAAFLHSDSPPSALYAPENDSFFHHIVESIE